MMKVALVHDDLVQWGGAERMLVALSEVFPDAPIYTSVYNTQHPILKKQFASKKIITSFLQKMPGWRSLYKLLFFLHPLAFEQFDFSEYDLVISQTTRFAKSIITKPQTKHICYCHTPPRFLWNFSGEKVTPLLKPYFKWLRVFDQVSSRQRVDLWIAGSKNAQDRIKEVYGASSQVIYPFVEVDESIEPFDGGYLLAVSRLNEYKRVDVAIKVANKLKLPLKVVGEGPVKGKLQALVGPTVDFLGLVDEDTLKLLLSGCRALIVTAEEDFGLTSLEAQSFGKPVIAFRKGGVLETVVDGETGIFYDHQTPESLIEALQKLDESVYNLKKCRQQAQKFSKEKFIQGFVNLVSSF